MSADCCCPRDGCSKTAISACCLPSGACEQLRECDCLEKGGKWLERLDDGTGQGTTIPAPCDRCFYCKCCQAEDDSGALLYKGLGPPTKMPLFDTTNRCPTGTTRVSGSPLDSQGGCSGTCDVPCPPEVGACCHDCGCAENVTRCQCAAIIRNTPSKQGNWKGGGSCNGTNDSSCGPWCICVNKMLQTFPTLFCSAAYQGFDLGIAQGSCGDVAAAFPTYFAQLTAACAQSGGPPGGGGGGGGPPVTPPVPPRPPQPPAPPKPCSVPIDQNPLCTAKVWYTVQRDRKTRTWPVVASDLTTTVILNGGLRFDAAFTIGVDRCNTFQCCGSPVPSCATTPPAESFKCVTDLSTCAGNNTYQELSCVLDCNQTLLLSTVEYCEGVGTDRYPAYTTRTRERKCYEVSQPRDCCNRPMTGEVLISKPAEGIFNHLTNTWVTNNPQNPYRPATNFYLRPRQTCVGYDRNHSSC